MMGMEDDFQLNMHRSIYMQMFSPQAYHLDVKPAKKAILDGFRKTDEALLRESVAGGWQDGAMAVCIWVLGQTVFLANIGDAKAVVARASKNDGVQDSSHGGSPLNAIVLTREHTVIYPQSELVY